ncbi:phage tail family protein [Streptomyces sp. NPDC047967]|uniref:phage tail family protein n=1 Tax=Streptomyces sp. NPDC047967 TaxID=3154924 RepID=UPI0033FD37B8
MPVPALSVPVANKVNVFAPAPVKWQTTRVTLIGRSGRGEEIDLTGFAGKSWPGVFIQPGATGLDAPPFAVFSDDSPNLDGSMFRSARAAAREIMIPVYLHGVDRQTINTLKRKFFQALNPTRGYCLLRFTEGGITRQLTAYYKGGMEGAEGVDTAGFTWTRYGLTFTAMDPWYYATSEHVERWSFGTGEAFLHPSGLFPLRIAEGVMGGIGDLYNLTNPGDIEAWPVWTLKGPIKSFALTHEDGRTIKASALPSGLDLIPAGRSVTIDTRPGKKTVKDDKGTNFWPLLDVNPGFWQIDPGVSQASIKIVTGSGNAAVSLSFYPRFASYM